jgi:hypothetical protein
MLEELGLAAETTVEAADAHAGTSRDGGDGGIRTLAGEHGARGLEDASVIALSLGIAPAARA